MKKIIYMLLIISSLLLVTGCENKSYEYLKDLSFKELNEKLENKEEFFFVVSQDGCSHCEEFIPILGETLDEYKIVGYNFNLTKLSKEENEEFDKLFDVEGTPTTLFIKDGQEVSVMQRINGSVSKERLVSKLENNGYIK